ncbi:hypothetical protein GQ42DRAFT_153300 [Ramicandelaber brevisporus]|nr:hypothetical protein GQ42DRAFT_153300 [Ramicandelaber brevisporus]
MVEVQVEVDATEGTDADGDEYEYKKEAGAPGAPGDAGLAGRPAFPLSSEVGSMQGDSPGDAYLRLVMMQSSAMPKVFGTPLSTSTNDPIRSHSTVNTIDETSSATGKWQADFVKLFNNIRTSMEHRILNVQDFQASPPSSTSSKRVIPDPRTLFKRITQKNHMSRSEDIIATVVSMERQSVMAVIELSVGWIKEHQRLDYGHAQWLFYLLASLDDVLTSSQVSALRELALASNSILNQLHNHNLASEIASDLHREEASARTIVTIISRVFRQLDIVL